MLLQILANTPKWVFALFAALLWLGLNQLLTRRLGLSRITLLAVGMAAFSFYGTVSAFSAVPTALFAWMTGAVAVLLILFNRPVAAGTAYDAASRRFTVPGSAVPLALMMGIFFTKYAVGVALGMHLAQASDMSFALPVSALYGAFSGVFAARAARLWRVAMAQERQLLANPA
jgi:uncharacterized membrane protein YeiH